MRETAVKIAIADAATREAEAERKRKIEEIAAEAAAKRAKTATASAQPTLEETYARLGDPRVSVMIVVECLYTIYWSWSSYVSFFLLLI